MVMRGSVPIIAATPCRTTAWSSAIRTRISSCLSIVPPLFQKDDPTTQRRQDGFRLVFRPELLPGAAQTITHVALRPLQQWGDLLVRLAGREKAQTRQLVLRQGYTRPVSPALLGDFGRDPGR